MARVSDLVCLVSSCSSTNTQLMYTDPHKYANAIDSVGYQTLSILRAQGLNSTMGIIQNLENFQTNPKVKNEVRKLFTRFFESELEKEVTVMTLAQEWSQISLFIRAVQEIQPVENWRGYLLAEKISLSSVLELQNPFSFLLHCLALSSFAGNRKAKLKFMEWSEAVHSL